MPQTARPAIDVTTASWSKAPSGGSYSDTLREVSPDDSSLVGSPPDPQGSDFETRLSPLSWPKAGPQTLRVRLRKTDPAPLLGTVMLLQGAELIALRRPALTQAFQTFEYPLTDAEKSLITDVTDLRVRVRAGIATTTDCPQCNPAPRQWVVSVAGVTNGSCSDCARLNGTLLFTHATGCYWPSNTVYPCGITDPCFLEYQPANTRWELFVGATYARAAADWNCLGSNVMSLVTPTGCNNWPATLTVEPL